MSVIIVTPRPPLNLFEVVRMRVTQEWTTIYEVPKYEIPASGPTPTYYIEAAAIMTGVMIANTMATPIIVSVQALNTAGDAYAILSDTLVPVGDHLLMDLNRQVLRTDEILQIKCATAQTADVHFSFILNQREQFEVIV